MRPGYVAASLPRLRPVEAPPRQRCACRCGLSARPRTNEPHYRARVTPKTGSPRCLTFFSGLSSARFPRASMSRPRSSLASPGSFARIRGRIRAHSLLNHRGCRFAPCPFCVYPRLVARRPPGRASTRLGCSDVDGGKMPPFNLPMKSSNGPTIDVYFAARPHKIGLQARQSPCVLSAPP